MFGVILKLLPSIIPVVVPVVKMVESFFGGGRGDEKRKAAVAIVKVLLPAIEKAVDKDLVQDEEEFAEGVGHVVDAVVGILNSLGQLKKDG
jgi:hypothetical protein